MNLSNNQNLKLKKKIKTCIYLLIVSGTFRTNTHLDTQKPWIFLMVPHCFPSSSAPLVHRFCYISMRSIIQLLRRWDGSSFFFISIIAAKLSGSLGKNQRAKVSPQFLAGNPCQKRRRLVYGLIISIMCSLLYIFYTLWSYLCILFKSTVKFI